MPLTGWSSQPRECDSFEVGTAFLYNTASFEGVKFKEIFCMTLSTVQVGLYTMHCKSS
jgi:hypothetical protein